MTSRAPLEILLVRNARSPAARTASQRAREIFAAGGYHTELVDAPSAGQLTIKLTETLGSRVLQVAAVVAVGGDGLAHGTLQVVQRARQQGVSVAFGLIPAGSGNDLARFFGLPTRDVERAAGRVLRGLESRARYMDLLRVECSDGSHHVCATAVSLGAEARVNARANRWNQVRWPAKYVVALLSELVGLQARRYALELGLPRGGSRSEERTATFLAVANTSSFGGGFVFAPRADPHDGLAELFSVSDAGPLRLLSMLPHVLLRTHERLDQVSLESVTDVTVTPLPRVRRSAEIAHGDGEALGPLPVRVSVAPRAVRVLF